MTAKGPSTALPRISAECGIVERQPGPCQLARRPLRIVGEPLGAPFAQKFPPDIRCATVLPP